MCPGKANLYESERLPTASIPRQQESRSSPTEFFGVIEVFTAAYYRLTEGNPGRFR